MASFLLESVDWFYQEGFGKAEEENKEKKAERKEEQIQLLDPALKAWGRGECRGKPHTGGSF